MRENARPRRLPNRKMKTTSGTGRMAMDAQDGRHAQAQRPSPREPPTLQVSQKARTATSPKVRAGSISPTSRRGGTSPHHQEECDGNVLQRFNALVVHGETPPPSSPPAARPAPPRVRSFPRLPVVQAHRAPLHPSPAAPLAPAARGFRAARAITPPACLACGHPPAFPSRCLLRGLGRLERRDGNGFHLLPRSNAAMKLSTTSGSTACRCSPAIPPGLFVPLASLQGLRWSMES